MAAQRSGSPNRSARRSRVSASYSRRAGSTLICAVSAIVNTSRPEVSVTLEVEAQRRHRRVLGRRHRDDAELRRDLPELRPAPVPPRSRSRPGPQPAEERADGVFDGAAAGDARPGRLDGADQLVAASRSARWRARAGSLEAVDDQCLDVRLEVRPAPGSAPPAPPTPRGRARTPSRRPGSGTGRRPGRRRRCGRRTRGRSGSGTSPTGRRPARTLGQVDRPRAGRAQTRLVRAHARHGSQTQRMRRSSSLQQVAVVVGQRRAAEVAVLDLGRRGRRHRTGVRHPPQPGDGDGAGRAGRRGTGHGATATSTVARRGAAAAPARAARRRRPAPGRPPGRS